MVIINTTHLTIMSEPVVLSGGVVEASGATPVQRKNLYYSICIPLRLVLAYIVYKNVNSTPMKVLVMLLSAFSVYSNLLGLNSSRKVWWNRSFHLIVALSVLVSSVAGKMELVPILMVLDVLFGLIHSFSIKPWEI